MSLAAAGIGVLLVVGNHPLMWAFIIGATAASVISRLLYHATLDPKLTKEGKHDE
jgi:hypothetical protein